MMATGNLLTRIATTVGSRQGENIASAALVYLLERYDQARQAFIADLRAASGAALPVDLRFAGQVHQSGFGITDIAGLDANGAEQVIVEAKVGAGLGLQQVGTYLARLQPPVALFALLAPRRRLGYLFTDAIAQAGAHRTGPWVARTDRATLTAVSWEQVANSLRDGLHSDASAFAELEQVTGLYRHLETSTYVPLSGYDVSADSGRLMSSLVSVCERVLNELRMDKQTDIDFSTHWSATSHAIGRGGTIAGHECWFGIWWRRWADTADTPFWLQLPRTNPAEAARIVAGTDHIAGRAVALHRSAQQDVIIGTFPPLGVADDTVVAHLKDTIIAMQAKLGRGGSRRPAGEGSKDGAAGG